MPDWSSFENHRVLFDQGFYEGAGPDMGCDPGVSKNTDPYSLYLDGSLISTAKILRATNSNLSNGICHKKRPEAEKVVPTVLSYYHVKS